MASSAKASRFKHPYRSTRLNGPPFTIRQISRSLACLDTVLYLVDHVVRMPIVDTGAKSLGDRLTALFCYLVTQQRESLGASQPTIGVRMPTLMGVSWQWSLL
jgi:hypothetical protein